MNVNNNNNIINGTSNKLKNILHLIFLFFIILVLLNLEFVSKKPELFKDFIGPIDWLKCNSLGFNLFKEGTIGCGLVEIMDYGYAFLSIPYNKTLDIFYRSYLPYIIIFTFIYLTIKIINPKNKQEIFILYLALLNPSTLLLIERLNIDCLIFIITILIVFNRIYFINWFLAIYLTLVKVYPIVLLTSILIEDKKRNIKKIFLIIFILTILMLFYLYIYQDFYIFMINNLNSGGAGYHFLFSLNSMPKIQKYIFGFNYEILLFIFYLLFIYVSIIFYKKINIEKKLLIGEIYTFESKLFIIGGYLILFIFISSSNYFYKEVFLILLIPYIFKIKNKYQSKLFNILIYIFIIKYLYSFIYAYININDGISYVDGQRIFSNKFLIIIFFKSILDFMLMSVISALLIVKTKIYIDDKFKSNLNNSL